MQPEPAEQPLLPGREVVVRQVERGRDRQVLGGQLLESVHRSGQLGGPPGQGPRRMVVQLAGEHPDRQRQKAAEPDNLRDLGVGRAEPGPRGQPDIQLGCLARREGIQADRPRVLQRGQPPPGGDQHQAAPCARQQRPDLLAVSGIVQHQQQLPAGQPVPPQPGPRLQVGRDLAGRNPDSQQQAGERIGRANWPTTRGVPMQRQEDLPAPEAAGQRVRGVHSERGLADAGHPADSVDANPAARPRRGRQFLQLVAPPGERGNVAGQRPGRRRILGRGPA